MTSVSSWSCTPPSPRRNTSARSRVLIVCRIRSASTVSGIAFVVEKTRWSLR